MKRIAARPYVRFIILVLVMGSVFVTNAECSVYMAAKQPGAKDLSVLNTGTSRSHVIAELGAPVWSGAKAGQKVDVFAFSQGYQTGVKAGRAFFHAAADVVTLGLWEVIATPTESVFSGSTMKVEVMYDDQDRVQSATVIERQEEKPVSPEDSPVEKKQPG